MREICGEIGGLSVSRETFDLIKEYELLLLKWSPKINLVAKSTLPEIRIRHIEDCVNVYKCLGERKDHIVDLGSGAGLPGLVIAILAQEFSPDTRLSLIESDQRKAVFLRTATLNLGLPVNVINDRIESAEPQLADQVTARALAPLTKLLGYVSRHLKPDGVAILSKGSQVEKEIELAREAWFFELEKRKSGEGSILEIYDIKQIEHRK